MKVCSIIVFCLVLIIPVYSDSKSDYQSVILKSEQYPQLTKEAVNLAANKNLPTSIYIKDHVFIQPIIVKNNELFYSIVTNMLHPNENGYLATYNQIENLFNLDNAEIKYFENRYNKKKSNYKILAPGDSLYLIPESTNDRILAFSAIDGDTIDLNFVMPDTTNDILNLPIDAIHHRVKNSIVVSDQVNNLIQEFDTLGVFRNTYAPVDTSVQILHNIRGMAFHPNTNLLVTVAQGINEDAIVEFDFFGNYKRNFIESDDMIMDSPFDILPRSTDVLVSAIASNGIHRYDLDGLYLDDFITEIPFPEQLTELSNGDIAVANYISPSSGIRIYPSSGGTNYNLLSGITGNRGVAELSNGNLLTTNSSGVWLIDRTSGIIIDTLAYGVSARFISLYVVDDILFIPIAKIMSDTLKFGSVFFDSTNTETLFVRNFGNSELLINNVYSNHSDITISPDTGIIAINDSGLFEISFSAFSDSSTEAGYIIFQSNSPSSPDSIFFNASLVTGLSSSGSAVPQYFSVSQNYPNPFNPETAINFEIAKSEFVNLSIYNINGKKVVTLINSKKSAGKHSIIWNASKYASGIYYYVFRSGEKFKEIKKMILLK